MEAARKHRSTQRGDAGEGTRTGPGGAGAGVLHQPTAEVNRRAANVVQLDKVVGVSAAVAAVLVADHDLRMCGCRGQRQPQAKAQAEAQAQRQTIPPRSARRQPSRQLQRLGTDAQVRRRVAKPTAAKPANIKA